ALLADGEQDVRTAPRFLRFCRDQASRRAADEGDAETAVVIAALLAILGSAAEARVRPTELHKALAATEGLDWVRSPKSLAGLLAPLGLTTRTLRFADGTRSRGYLLERDRLEDIQNRYAPDAISETSTRPMEP